MDETLGIIQKQIQTELSKVADVSVIHPLVAREEINQLLGDYDLLEGTLSAGESRTAVFIFLDSCHSGGRIPKVHMMGYEGTVYAVDFRVDPVDPSPAAPPEPEIVPPDVLGGGFIDGVIAANIEFLEAQIIIGKFDKKSKSFNAFPARYDVINVDSRSGPPVLKETMELIVERIEYK